MEPRQTSATEEYLQQYKKNHRTRNKNNVRSASTRKNRRRDNHPHSHLRSLRTENMDRTAPYKRRMQRIHVASSKRKTRNRRQQMSIAGEERLR